MKKLIITILPIFFIITMICYPTSTYAAAREALTLWWGMLLPALLPFFIAAELLVAFGATAWLGRLLNPLMRPLFNLPGTAAVAIAMGYTSGFPTGATITATLFNNGDITAEEGTRLIAFTNNPSLIFITVGVATGILGEPSLGLMLIVINYGINLLIGISLGIVFRVKNTNAGAQFPTPLAKGGMSRSDRGDSCLRAHSPQRFGPPPSQAKGARQGGQEGSKTFAFRSNIKKCCSKIRH